MTMSTEKTMDKPQSFTAKPLKQNQTTIHGKQINSAKTSQDKPQLMFPLGSVTRQGGSL